MDNWLGEQIEKIASQWAGAVERHYPDAVPYWTDAARHMEMVHSKFWPAIQCLPWAECTAAPGVKVLDLGAGTGWLSAFLSRFPNVASVDCLDSDHHNLEVMLPEITKLVEGDASKINPIVGLFSPLLVPDGHYDLVVASSSIHHAPDLFEVMRELRRVISPDGVVVLLNELPRTFDGYMSYMLHLFGLMLDRIQSRSLSEHEEFISAAGIHYDRKLGDIAYAGYQYRAAITSAGLECTFVDSGEEISGMSLQHIVCRPRGASTFDVPVDDPGLEPLTQARVQQLRAIIVGEIDYADRLATCEREMQELQASLAEKQALIEAMQATKIWRLRTRLRG